MARGIPAVQHELESRVEALGFELVEAEWAGSSRRPILRIRIDLEGSAPGEGVTVDDCAVVSRGLEPWLDEHPDVPERYVLEVSSPGIERPLVRERDWSRFAGEDVVVTGKGVLGGKDSRIEGTLLGLEEGPDGPMVRIRLASGEDVSFALEEVKKAHLHYRWE